MESALWLLVITVIGRGCICSDVTNSDHDGIFHQYPFGDPRNCLQSQAVKETQDDIPLNIMQVLPGIGWDNLRNVEAGYVTELNYSRCLTTGDRRYLIPDNVYAIPIQHSMVQANAKLIQHWDEWKSYTASTINSEVSLFSYIGGKFSSSFQDMKTRFINERSQIARVELRHHFYSIKLHPNAALDSGLKSRLLEIASHLQNNRSLTADYLAELLVKEYGTDYTNSIEAGALLVQEDYLDSTYTNHSSQFNKVLTASAAASLFGAKLGASYGDSYGTSNLNEYLKNRHYSTRETFGGTPYQIGTTLEEWEKSLPNSLVAIDRSGFPLDYAITVVSFPELPSPTLRKLKKVVHSAIARYYSINTYRGCADRSSPNFDYMANLGTPEACLPPDTNTTFGGIYQSCSRLGKENLCAELEQVNPLTGGFSCPSGYQPVLVTNGNVRSSEIERRCQEVCTRKRHLIFFSRTSCSTHCENIAVPSSATFEGYWCAAIGKVSYNSGYLFGGLYTTKKVNPVTGAHSCAQHYIRLRLGTDINICVSNDYELAGDASLPFAGFHSCLSGNPLAADVNHYGNHLSGTASPKRCPCGFSQHLADITNNCQINYCVGTGHLKTKRLPEVILPPFKKKPVENQWSTETIAVQAIDGKLWIPINGTKRWKVSTQKDVLVKDDEAPVGSSGTSVLITHSDFVLVQCTVGLIICLLC